MTDDRVEHPGSHAEAETEFEIWLRPHWQAMGYLAYRLSGRDEWEDVLQEALCVAWRKREKFDPGRGSARNWLLALTADQARKAHRRRVANLRLVRVVAEEPHSDLLSSPDLARAHDIEVALRALTTRQRTAVELHYYLGLTLGDVALVMSCTEGTVKSTLADARSKLRANLGDYLDH